MKPLHTNVSFILVWLPPGMLANKLQAKHAQAQN